MSKNVPKVLRSAVLLLNHIGLAITVASLILEHFFTRTVRLDGFATEMIIDPWSKWVMVGIVMMMAGAVGLIFIAPRPAGKKQWLKIASGVILLGFVFLCLTLRKPGSFINNPNPALQSPWFAPHVIAYMIAYSLMAIAAVMALCMFVKKALEDKLMPVTDGIVYAGVAFLTIGMVLGAIWARQAWGAYWNWDPKENWALVTWGCYLVFLHMRKAAPRRRRAACVILLIGFICLQMCWWGVNYLPAASIHSYN